MRRLIFLLAFLWVGVVSAADFIPGEDYVVLPESVLADGAVSSTLSEADGKVQVIQFFSYGCVWCYRLESAANDWLANQKGIHFIREPVIFQPAWRPLAKAYHALIALDRQNLHDGLFDAVQANPRDFSSDEKIRNYFLEQGIAAADFDEVYGSFSLNMQLERTNALLRAFSVLYIPVFVVNTPSAVYLTSVDHTKTQERLFEVLDYLVAQAQS